MSVRKRGSSWEARVEVGSDPATGKRRQETATFPRKKDALDWETATRQAVREGRYVATPRKTVEVYLAEWLRAVRPSLRATTAAGYQVAVEKYVAPWIGAAPLGTVTPLVLNGLYGDLLERGGQHGKPLAAKTVRGVHAVLSKAFADAVRWGLLPANPAQRADPPKVRQAKMRTWSEAELRRFLGHVRDDRLFAAWVLLATTGMRREEVCGLHWDSVDLTAGTVQVGRVSVITALGEYVEEDDAKSETSKRPMSLDPITVAALRRHRTAQAEERLLWGPAGVKDPNVFTLENGARLKPPWLTRRFNTLVEQAGLPRIRLHDVRHTYATTALRAGVPVHVVARRLGHKDPSVTLRVYAHALPTDDETAALRVADAIFGSAVSIP